MRTLVLCHVLASYVKFLAAWRLKQGNESRSCREAWQQCFSCIKNGVGLDTDTAYGMKDWHLRDLYSQVNRDMTCLYYSPCTHTYTYQDLLTDLKPQAFECLAVIMRSGSHPGSVSWAAQWVVWVGWGACLSWLLSKYIFRAHSPPLWYFVLFCPCLYGPLIHLEKNPLSAWPRLCYTLQVYLLGSWGQDFVPQTELRKVLNAHDGAEGCFRMLDITTTPLNTLERV